MTLARVPKYAVVLLMHYVLLSGSMASAQPSSPIDSLVGQKYVPGHLLVKFRQGTGSGAVATAHIAIAGEVLRTYSSVDGLQLVRFSGSTTLSHALASYRNNPDVLYAEPDYVLHAFQTPNDSLFPQMWSLQNSGQAGGTPGADIHATQAWNITTGSSNVVIAVIDTGVDYNHPDLAARCHEITCKTTAM